VSQNQQRVLEDLAGLAWMVVEPLAPPIADGAAPDTGSAKDPVAALEVLPLQDGFSNLPGSDVVEDSEGLPHVTQGPRQADQSAHMVGQDEPVQPLAASPPASAPQPLQDASLRASAPVEAPAPATVASATATTASSVFHNDPDLLSPTVASQPGLSHSPPLTLSDDLAMSADTGSLAGQVDADRDAGSVEQTGGSNDAGGNVADAGTDSSLGSFGGGPLQT